MKSVKRPKIGTLAYHDFFNSWNKINSFLEFVVNLVGYSENVQTTAHNALFEFASDDEKIEMKKKWNARISPVEMLSKHRQFFLEIILVRHVENYLAYLSSILFEIFTQRPETLKSNEKIDWDTVLSHDSIPELIRTLSEKKVDSLSYKSFEDLNSFFSDKFGIELIEKPKVKTIIDAIETRNISVHNRCIINKRYVQKTAKGADRLGKTRILVLGDLEDTFVPLFAESVTSVDKNVRKVLKVKACRNSK